MANSFELKASCIHLTYGKKDLLPLKGHLNFQTIMEKVTAIRGVHEIIGFSLVHERGTTNVHLDDASLDGEGGTPYDHTHAAFWFSGRVHKCDAAKVFDIPDVDDVDRPFHPNIKTGGAKLFQRCLVYHRKTWEKPDGFTEGPPKHFDKKPKGSKETYGQLYEAAVDKAKVDWPMSVTKLADGTWDFTNRHLWQLEPASKSVDIAIMQDAVDLSREEGIIVAAQSVGATCKSISEIEALDRIMERQEKKRKLDDANFKHLYPDNVYDPDMLAKWELIKSMGVTWIIWGKPKLGKTLFACSLEVNGRSEPLLVNSVEALRKFRDGFHTHIVIDDPDLTYMTDAEAKALTEMEKDVQLNARYSQIELPRGVLKVICANDPADNGDHVFKESQVHSGWMEKRTRWTHVRKKLSVSVPDIVEHMARKPNDF